LSPLSEIEVPKTQRTERAKANRWKVFCGAVVAAVVLCVAVDAVFDRNFSKNISDGVAYLDIADAVGRGRLAALSNPYWSPGYPVALQIGLALLRPSPARELAALYVIDGALAMLALSCLVYFVKGLPIVDRDGHFGLTRPMLLAVAFSLFLIAVQRDAPPQLMTPDLLLAACLWLGGGAFLRIAHGQWILDYVILAFALALAYFTKAVALSLVVVAGAVLPFTGPYRRKAIRGVLTYFFVVFAMISPYVAGLSKSKGRFTLGESGSLNYAWIVDGADGPNRWHLQNDSPHGHAQLALAHPARRLLRSPDVYEFGSPVDGSFPIFNDPSYWDDGLRPVFYMKGQLWHIAMNLYHTASWLARRGEFVIALLFLLCLQVYSRTPGRFRETLPVFVWFASLWGLYLLVDVEDRYVFAVLTSIFLLAVASLRLPDFPHMRQAVTVCTIILVSGAVIRSLDVAGEKVFYGIRQMFIGPVKMKAVGPYQNPYWEVAQKLTGTLGLHANDSVACMELGCDNTYWARLAGLRVTADISREAEYWAASRADRARAMAALAGAGVKAVVARHLGTGAESEGWTPLSDPNETPAQELYARLTQ